MARGAHKGPLAIILVKFLLLKPLKIRIHPMTYVGLKVEGVATVTKAHLALSIDLS